MNIKSILPLSALFLSHIYFAQETPKKESDKEKEIESVTITKTKKAVEQKADRTIFDFSEQPSLNSGSVMEGLKKLPGLVATDIAGMMYQGKLLDVFMDGRPLNISSNELNAFLEGMPANAIERIEIVTNPGAEFPATSGGAILNIITGKSAKNYLTATYSGNYNFTNYDKYRSRVNNSMNLNARNKLFGWQLNFGQNYRESSLDSNQDNLVTTNTDRIVRNYFAKTAVTFDLGEDRLLLNYDIYHNNNDFTTLGNGIFQGINYNSEDLASTLINRNEAVATYQKRFSDKNKKLDLKVAYSNSKSGFVQQNLINYNRTLDNNSDMNNFNFRVDYTQALKIFDEGKVSMGGLYEKQNFETQDGGITNLDYQRQTASSYVELQAKLKQFDFILGTRAEDYDIAGIYRERDSLGEISSSKNLMPFKKFKLFPNASVQYNFMKQVYFTINYNKKISLPSISVLNPNNNTFAGPNSDTNGNPELQPAIYDNYEAKISAFDYAFIGYNLSVAKNQVVQKISRKDDVIRNTQVNISELKIHNFNLGIPIPFMVFSKSIKEMLKFDFNPDKINFLYLYAAYQKHQLPDIETKGFWIFNLMAQIILPKEIKFVANYNYTTTNGNYYYFVADKPLNNSFDITLSKKFMNDRLTVSVYADDIFNTQMNQFHSISQSPNVYLSSKYDTRRFGVSFNYKIPTRNKLAKEENNLNSTKKEDSAGSLPQN
ncbi:MAG: outer membrane beta-barrel protein [Chryseobacterium sp.]|nr:outer membrane beta-barrel protein [Chryseobacterium sp.]